MKIFRDFMQFEWDAGNQDKNFILHQATNGECEEVFFDEYKKILHDVLHSGDEPRYILMGTTKHHRLLFVVFTIRGGKVRIISARDCNKKERRLYEEKEPV